MKMKRVFLTVLTLLAICLPACFTAAAETPGWEEKLKTAEGVISVERIDIPMSELFTEKYLVTFEQPLDWNDPSNGTFPQRVEVGLREDAEYNILETNGYFLLPVFLLEDDPSSELPHLLKANFFNVEHRFFGESRPEGISNDEVEYWEYMTAENAAKDYHRIYTSISSLTDGGWIATGTSRGGEMTNVYGYFFPEDMNLYVPYVAPCSEGPEDPRYYRFIYTEIGNAVYGEEKAREYRALILTFQVELMRNKALLLPDFEAEAAENGHSIRECVTADRIYDLCVMEFAGGFWQYQRIPFEELQAILDMPETTETEKKSKQKAELRMLLTVQDPSAFSTAAESWPYFVGAATTYGQYHYDFSFLREALQAACLEKMLSVAEDAEDGILFEAVFTEEQRDAFIFDSSFRDALEASMATTPAKHLMIYGAADPWISLRLSDTDNPNVKVCIHPTRDHTASIRSMPEDMKEEILAVLKEWIGAESSSDDGRHNPE